METKELSKAEIKAQAEAFCDKAKAYRKSAEGLTELAEMAPAVQSKVREILEGNRGFRRVNGKMEFSKEALVAHIARLEEKAEMYDERKKAIKGRISELKADLADRFGDEGNN